MLNNYPLLDTEKTARLGCYASFPGSGPSAATCSGCAFQSPDKAKFVCDKYQALTGRKGKPISPATAACRYFTARRTFAAPLVAAE